MKNYWIGFMLAASGILLGACTSSEDGESLRLVAFPSTLSAGDTSDVLLAEKRERDAQGRLETDSPYTHFYLVSGDTTVARIRSGRFIIGVAAGHTWVTAHDQNSALVSQSYALSVQ